MSVHYDPVQADPPAVACAEHAQPGTFALYRWIMGRQWVGHLPRRIAGAGTIHDRELVACRPKDNVPGNSYSLHADGRAGDVGMPIVDGAYVKAVGDAIWRFLHDHREALGIQSMVFWEHDLDADGNTTPFGGSNHHDHLHFEQNLAGAALTEAQVLSIVQPEEDSLPFTEEQLIAIVRKSVAAEIKDFKTETAVAFGVNTFKDALIEAARRGDAKRDD